MDGVMFGLIISWPLPALPSSPSGSTGGAIRTAGCPGGAPSRNQVTPTGTTSGVPVGEEGGRSWAVATAVAAAATAAAAPAKARWCGIQPAEAVVGDRARYWGLGGLPTKQAAWPHHQQ
jgi:hypothetical protein